MRTADRVGQVGESQTMAFGAKVKQLRAEGERVWDFTVGEPDVGTPAYVKQAAKDALDDGITKYTTVWGLPRLREAVAATAQGAGFPASPEEVLVAPAKHLLYLAFQAYLEQGDEVLVPTPAWVSYAPMVRLAGAEPVEVPCDADAGFRLDLDALAEATGSATRAVIVNTPSNPTGAVQDRSTLAGLADLAIDEDLLVVADELYEHLTYDADHASVGTLDGMWERTVTVNGFSKAFAMTGWRLGWAVAPRDLLEPMARIQTHSLTCATSFAQAAGAVALDDPEETYANMRKTFRERRDVLADAVGDAPWIGLHVPQGAFYLFPRVDTDLDSHDLAMHLIEEARVATVPGSAFGRAGEGHLRLAYTTDVESCREGGERLVEAVEEL